jgi:hypothetical protein
MSVMKHKIFLFIGCLITSSFVFDDCSLAMEQSAMEQESQLCTASLDVLGRICTYLVRPVTRPSDARLMQDLVAYRGTERDSEYMDDWFDLNSLMMTCKDLYKKIPRVVKDNYQGFFLDFSGMRWSKKQSLQEFFDIVFKRINAIANRYPDVPFELNLSSNVSKEDLHGQALSPFIDFFKRLEVAGIAKRIIYLHLCCNNLRSLPCTISCLTNLRALNLQKNKLREAQALLPIMGLRDLKELELRNNKLLSLPSQITALSNLTFLDVAFNSLQKHDVEVVALLKNLFILDVSRNAITCRQLGQALCKKGAGRSLKLVLADGLLDDKTEQGEECFAELGARGVEIRATC